jgi:hypothetical protein
MLSAGLLAHAAAMLEAAITAVLKTQRHARVRSPVVVIDMVLQQASKRQLDLLAPTRPSCRS